MVYTAYIYIILYDMYYYYTQRVFAIGRHFILGIVGLGKGPIGSLVILSYYFTPFSIV